MDEYLTFALDISAKTGEMLLKHFRKSNSIQRGSPKEVKSFYDTRADKMLIKALKETFSTHSYLTEESGLIKKDPEYLWIIDPIDGTNNFVNSNPFFSISISLWIKNKPYLGVIHAPFLKETYIAHIKQGAWLEDKLHKTKTTAKTTLIENLDSSYILYCEGGQADRNKTLNLINQIYPKVKGFRKLGSAALELAFVGIGRADAYLTPYTCLWDIAAGILFVNLAGGSLTNFDQKKYKWEEFLNKKNIDLIAFNGKLKIPQLKN